MTSFGVPTATRKPPIHRRSIHSHHPHPSLAKPGRTASTRRAATPASYAPSSAQSSAGRHVCGLSPGLACPLSSPSTPLRVLARPAGTHKSIPVPWCWALHPSQRDAYRAVLTHVNVFYVLSSARPARRRQPCATDLLPAPVSLPPDTAARPWTMHAWADNS